MILCLLIIAGQNYAAFTADKIDWFGVAVSYIGIPFFLVLYIGYKIVYKTKVVKLEEADLSQGFDVTNEM